MVIRSNGREWTFPPTETVRVGRDASAHVRLDDDRVSRVHLKIRHSDGLWWVADEASHNGTWIIGAERLMDESVAVPPGGLRLRLGHVDGPEVLVDTRTAGAAAEPRVVTIGRSHSSDVAVDDPLASRRHAVIEIGKEAVLRDA
ncbi:FHA domain-containing protein, partial [Escherichia coli]|uniref:FHA domain-containing protein n=1 Tax=Escherichia coli TaxID=562 RepID=UPI0032E52CF3